MGDISRHRDIFLNTREAIPRQLLDKVKVPLADLTYLELGNYFTDVSQFRDPVVYIFSKRRIWRDKVLPGFALAKNIAAGVLAAGGSVLALLDKRRAAAATGATALAALAVADELLADLLRIDNWVDALLGKPFEGVKGKRRKDEDYGFVGQFFKHFIAGITQLLFAKEATLEVPGPWATIERIPERSLADVFEEFFTQYYPHEHTDQPPYVWDASQRHKYPKWYGVSRRQHSLVNEGGIMRVVDVDYIQYLAEELWTLEAQWRAFKDTDVEPRRKALVRLGKILHGVEDWFFHSNVVELIRLRAHTPKREGETDEVFVQRFVRDELRSEPGFSALPLEERTRQQRVLYRRLRFPIYDRGNRENSGGILTTKPSTLSLDLAYPAFPSQQDTSHTLLGALENLEGHLHGSNSNLQEIPPWLECAIRRFAQDSPEGRRLFREKAAARGSPVPQSTTDTAGMQSFIQSMSEARAKAILVDVMREWIPLVVTLLYESERQRIVANVDHLVWTNRAAAANLPKGEPKQEEEKQLERHGEALKPKLHSDGVTENNYGRAIRFVRECGYLSARGRAALDKAFEFDRQSEEFSSLTPGAGGFLMQFALELQEVRDTSEDVTKQLNERGSIYDPSTDIRLPAPRASDAKPNSAFDEIVGSHSLMSKDTVDSSPFFLDAKVLASVASQAVLHIFFDEVSSPAGDSAVDWVKVLRFFIRYPAKTVSWERRAMAFFREKSAIDEKNATPKFADLPELAELAKGARIPRALVEEQRRERQKKGAKAAELEELYTKLERQLSDYRRP